MDRFTTSVETLIRRDEGQDLIEYAMLCALIAVVAIGAITSVGNTINTVLWQVIAAAVISFLLALSHSPVPRPRAPCRQRANSFSRSARAS